MMFYPFNINLPLNCYLILDGTALCIAYERGNKQIILLNIAKEQ